MLLLLGVVFVSADVFEPKPKDEKLHLLAADGGAVDNDDDDVPTLLPLFDDEEVSEVVIETRFKGDTKFLLNKNVRIYFNITASNRTSTIFTDQKGRR